MNCGLKVVEAVDHELILDLVGPFQLRDAQGTDLTPRSRKAQGLLALIGASPRLRRSRTWLQDKLWSDRGPEQGAASLRQCLSEIRSVLRRHLTCFRTELGWIGLDPERVLVNTTLPDRSGGEYVEFLEGIDIRDPEFENWLREQRAFYFQSSDRSHDIEAQRAAPQEILPATFGGGAPVAELIQAHQARIAALERVVGRQALELELLKEALRDGAPTRTGPMSVIVGAPASEVPRNFRRKAEPLSGEGLLMPAGSAPLRPRTRSM